MNPASSAALSSVSGQFALAVQKKVNESAARQGEAELQLIESATLQKASTGSVGTQLHLVA
jgi:hypothetical protein